MYRFGTRSKKQLSTVHPDLQRVISRAMQMQIMDFSVLEGLRSLSRQKRLKSEGKSKTLRSKHLEQPDGYSHAVDIAPYPIDWLDSGRFHILNGIIRAAAKEEGVKIRTGADWDSDGHIKDQRFHDLPHIELITN